MISSAPTIPDLEHLPDDSASLKSIVQNLSQILNTFQDALKDQGETIERLRHQLYLAAKHRYGRKSEQINDDQLSIFLQEIEGRLGKLTQNAQKPADEIETVTYTRKKGHGRSKPPENLPILRVEHPLSEEKKTCLECQKPLTKMGEDVRNTLEYIPSVTYIRQDVLEKWACSCCKGAPVTSEAPVRPIERCIAGPGLLAQVVTAKYADHLPLYRQSEIFERGGLEISRSTLCGWVGSVAGLLEPLYEAMKEDVLKSKVIHTDDTPVPYLPASPPDGSSPPMSREEIEAEEDKERKAKTGRLWTYVGDKTHAHIVYEFTENRCAEHPKAFLGDWKGYLQADAYTGYDCMFKPDKAKEVACMAHARRKFNDAKVSDRSRAKMAMAFIRTLYQVEWEADEKKLDAVGRKALREEKSRPILKAFKEWLDAQALVTLPKSPFGEAVNYSLNQWEALNRYVEDGDLNIDNNTAERALRGVAVGRKNWLFAGSVAGGKWAAILYSLVASCKRHKIDPYIYLRDVISRVKTHPMSRIQELLPATYVPGPVPETPVFQNAKPVLPQTAPTTPVLS
jgi:transposase